MRTVHPVLAAQVLNKLLKCTSMKQKRCCEPVRARACTCDDGVAIGILSLRALRSSTAGLPLPQSDGAQRPQQAPYMPTKALHCTEPNHDALQES